MSNIGEILKEIEKNKMALKVGTEFYYADRNSKKPVKCVIQKIELGYQLPYSQREKTPMKYSDAMTNLDAIH